MESTEAVPAKPGLRERKKQLTRDTIAKVALQLFSEHGYDNTTLADIAEAANVSPRTIFAYFDRKEDILLCDEMVFYEHLKQTLEQRPPGTTTVDAFRDFLRTIPPPSEEAMLRKKIIHDDEELRLAARAHHGRVEQLIAELIAQDLDAPPGDIRPVLVAASMTAMFTDLRDRLEAEAGGPMTFEQAIAVLEDVLEFLRGGLEALQRARPS
jgi:AcrR family transcriptional regulator